MAFKFVFLRTPKPRRFYHKPIYWDPEKEARDEHIAEAKKNVGIVDDNEPYKPSIKRGSFRRIRFDVDESVDYKKDTKNVRRQSNIRLLFIIAALLLIAFFLYMSSSSYLSL